MNLGLVGDETIHLVADMSWIESKFLEILERANPEWLITFDLPGTAELRKLLDHDIFKNNENLFDPKYANLRSKRLVLVKRYYQPRWCEIALQDMDIMAYSDYLVIFSNGQAHSLLDSLRKGMVLEINYLEKSEKWRKYA